MIGGLFHLEDISVRQGQSRTFIDKTYRIGSKNILNQWVGIDVRSYCQREYNRTSNGRQK